MKDGPSKKQLQARIAKLEAELAKYRRGDTVRVEGAHWYELLEFFDGETITRIPAPWKEPTYLMGMLSDTFVVEVPPNAPPQDVDRFLGLLKANGMAPALAIRKGVRFLRLATVAPEMEARLDAVQAAKRKDAVRGEEGAGELPGMRAGEGGPENGEVLEVPGAASGGAPDGGPDPQCDARRE